MKKKRINEGFRNLPSNFVKEKDIEANIKQEIAKEIINNKKR